MDTTVHHRRCMFTRKWIGIATLTGFALALSLVISVMGYPVTTHPRPPPPPPSSFVRSTVDDPQIVFQSNDPSVAAHRKPCGHHHKMLEANTILDILSTHEEFSKLLELIQKDSEITKILGDTGSQATFFAPTNEAFDTITDIDYPTRDTLLYHIAAQVYNSTALHEQAVIQSLYEPPGLKGSSQMLRISRSHSSIPATSAQQRSPTKAGGRHHALWEGDMGWMMAEADYGLSPISNQDDDGNDGDDDDDDDVVLYVNRAKVTIPDLASLSGGIVHGINRIIKPPGETIPDEIMRKGLSFSHLIEAWNRAELDLSGQCLTLFAANDQAWEKLPKKLFKWLFSDAGRDHLKIFSMYQVASSVVYTPEILTKVLDEGEEGEGHYTEHKLSTLLKSPLMSLYVKGVAPIEGKSNNGGGGKMEIKPTGLTDLIMTVPAMAQAKIEEALALASIGQTKCKSTHPLHPCRQQPDKRNNNHHHNINNNNNNKRPTHHHKHDHKHPHHDHGDKHGKKHHHKHGKGHKGHHPHHGDHPHPSPHPPPHPRPDRDEIVINNRAHVVQGMENWIAGNGVIHVVDRVLIPSRSNGCESMTPEECAVWETVWDLAEESKSQVKSLWDDIASWVDAQVHPIVAAESKATEAVMEKLETKVIELEGDKDGSNVNEMDQIVRIQPVDQLVRIQPIDQEVRIQPIGQQLLGHKVNHRKKFGVWREGEDFLMMDVNGAW